jgi:hypothetical protein
MQNFVLIFSFLARIQDQEKRANRISMSEMNQRLPGNSLTKSVIDHLNNPQGTLPSSNPISLQITSELTGMQKKNSVIEGLLQSGRANDSPDSLGCFEQAIALGSLSARADLALFCFIQKPPYAECRKAFELLQEGHESGCSDCTGMLACFYTTGFRGVVARCDETAYRLACASADAGSLFGKMALAHFLKSLLGPIDPDEDTFYVSWTDPFIRNFAIPSIDVPEDVPASSSAEDLVEDVPVEDEDPFKDWSESDLDDWFGIDKNILSQSNIRRIAILLIEEIQQEHACNPNIPKVWLNLPAL